MDTTPDPASDHGLDLAKARLRARLRAGRRALALSCPQAPHDAAHLAPVRTWAGFGVVAGYVAMGSELDPAPLLARLAAAGARIVLPVVTSPGAPLIFRDAVAPAGLVPDAVGALAPPISAPQAVPRVVITPLLAFDARGGRLGQGGGHYDRTLAALRARGPVTAVGLAYADQQVERVPAGPLDQRMDAILTERGYRRI